MEQKRTAPRAQKTQPLTYREWKRRKQLRLARNWGLFLAGCALVVFLLTKGILWLLPHLHGADGPQTFAASAYDSTAPRAQKTQPLTYREWKRRKQLRLARNWGLFLAGCALVVFLLTKGILWLLPHLHGADGPQTFAASAYDSTGYFFDADDARLVLVNANLPFDEEPSPTLDAADEAGTQLEAEAAQQYRSMAAAAQADGITLTLVTGYQDADTRTAAHEAQKQTYLARHKSEEEASARAAAILPEADANEHGTGYAADILSTDYTAQDTGFADTRAYQWLTAYAAEYGFILRYPEDRQAITGVVFEPWHWRYVGVENALAIRASGLSLEEFLAEQKAL